MKQLKLLKQIIWTISNMAVIRLLSMYLVAVIKTMIEYHWMCFGMSLIIIFTLAGWKAIENIIKALAD